MTESTQWDPEAYDRDFAFVAKYGAELLEWLEIESGESIVDLGCGTGELTAKILEAGASVIGIDADPDMIAAARTRLPDDVELRVADGLDFSVEHPVDAVFSNAALHWMPAPVEVLGCVTDALRTGGRFVAEMGASGNVATVRRAVDQACREAALLERDWPWFFPSPGEFAVMLEAAGLEIRRLDFMDRPTLLPGEHGFIAWLRMFAGAVVDDLPTDVLERAEEIAEQTLWYDDAWWADYRRLRFRAVKVD